MNAVSFVVRCCDLFTVGVGISPRMQRVEVVMKCFLDVEDLRFIESIHKLKLTSKNIG